MMSFRKLQLRNKTKNIPYNRAKDKEILVLRLKTEADQYKLVMQTKMNEEIIFGSEVLFKHIDSD